jgi:hypothetical protein
VRGVVVCASHGSALQHRWFLVHAGHTVLEHCAPAIMLSFALQQRLGSVWAQHFLFLLSRCWHVHTLCCCAAC